MTGVRVSVRPGIVDRSSWPKPPPKPWIVNWSVERRGRSRAFATRREAARFQSRLLTALDADEAFSVQTGLPVSMDEAVGYTSVTVLDLARAVMEAKWSSWSPGHRASMLNCFARLLEAPALRTPTRKAAPAPKAVRAWLMDEGLRPASAPLVTASQYLADGLTFEQRTYGGEWLRACSLPVHTLTATAIEDALDAANVLESGRRAAGDHYTHLKTAIGHVCTLAVRRRLLTFNPVRDVPRKVAPRRMNSLDASSVPSPAQVADIINCVVARSRRGRNRSGERYFAPYFWITYYTGARPSEMLGLRNDGDVRLPCAADCPGRPFGTVAGARVPKQAASGPEGASEASQLPVVPSQGSPLAHLAAPACSTHIRPPELAGLPEGWGSLTIRTPLVFAGSRFTDDGSTQQRRRGLKARAEGEQRLVHLPPEAVAVLMAYLEDIKPSAGGPLWVNEDSKTLTLAAVGRAFRNAVRELYAPPHPLHGIDAYNLRHAHISARLRSGEPTAEIAATVGNSVTVIHKTYARVIGELNQASLIRRQGALTT